MGSIVQINNLPLFHSNSINFSIIVRRHLYLILWHFTNNYGELYVANYLNNILFMPNQKVVGIAKDCLCQCEGSKKQDFTEAPHKGNHEIYETKQFIKKINGSKMVTINQYINEYMILIENSTKQLIQNIKSYEQKTIKQLKKVMFSSILNDDALIDDALIQKLIKISNCEYEVLTCSEIYQVFSQIDKNKKIINLQTKAESLHKKFQQNISESLRLNSSVFSSKIKTSSTGKSFSDNQLPQKNKHSSFQRMLDQSLVQEGFPNMYAKQENFQRKQKQQDSELISASFSSSSQSLSIQFSVDLKDDKQKQKSQRDASIKGSPQKKESIPSESFFSNNMEMKNKDEQSEQDTKFKKHKKKEIMSQKKMGKQTPQYQQQINEKQIEMGKSYINKAQGKYFIPVSYLQKKQYKESRFNIRLKIVQPLMFRLLEDKNNNKIHKKAKFVAGDETGVVICYTNYIPQIQKDKYIELHDCQIDPYKDQSYEITSTKCRPLQVSKNKQFQVNFKTRISKIDSIDPLIYSIQKQQRSWPSVLGLAYLESKLGRTSQLIAQIDEIIEETQQKISCFLSDGTAKIYAIADKDAFESFKQGDVYFIKKLKVFQQMQGKQLIRLLKISKQNKPHKVQFTFSKMDVKSVDEIINLVIVNK